VTGATSSNTASGSRALRDAGVHDPDRDADARYADAFDEWDEWRPKAHETLDSDVRKKTADQASVEGKGEKAGKKPDEDIKTAGEKLSESYEQLEEDDAGAAVDNWKESIDYVARAADSASRKAPPAPCRGHGLPERDDPACALLLRQRTRQRQRPAVDAQRRQRRAVRLRSQRQRRRSRRRSPTASPSTKTRSTAGTSKSRRTPTPPKPSKARSRRPNRMTTRGRRRTERVRRLTLRASGRYCRPTVGNTHTCRGR